MQRPENHSYRFGSFLLDTDERVLLRAGQPVPLAPKAYDTLVALVERNGHIVEKEQLIQQVWPGTFVEEVSLAKNISTLRKTLGQAEGEHYIETVPKRGYRFVAKVRDSALECASETPAEGPVAELGPTPAQAVPVKAARRSVRLAAFLVLAAVAGLIVWLLVLRGGRDVRASFLKISPLTSYPGREDHAAFSPDGNQIAFAWDEHQNGNRDICVKMIGTETLLRLTNGPENDSKPVWSPDGRFIAFLRRTPSGSAYYLISALGGAERKLADVYPYLDFGVGSSPYYSPDGKFLAIIDKQSPSEPSGIFLLSVSKSDKRRLTSPPSGDTGDYYPGFSPDGTMLAFVRSSSFSTTDLYVMPLSGGEPRRLTFDGLTIQGVAWTRDSREIIFSSRRGGSIAYLWRIPATGGTPVRIGAAGGNMLSPSVAARGDRLAYTHSIDDMNIWRVELDATGHAAEATQIIASTFWDGDPDYSPDGKKIAFTSGRSGGFGIWICDADGKNPRLLYDGGPYLTGTPRWSPDGRFIAFDSRSNDPRTGGDPDVYVISAEGGQPRRLTTDPAEDVAPSWSRDGRWVYFGSTRAGRMEIWKAPAAGGAAVQVTTRGGFEGFESPDGRHLYYLKGRAVPGIWRVRVEGGDETLVTDRNQAGLWRYWRVSTRGEYYATAAPPEGPRLELFELTTGRVRDVARMLRNPDTNVPGLAVSPDGRYLLYAQKDQSGSDTMMLEDFQ